ncbi:hypothetical protein D9758_013089 [Tetrapyrgos nigripes]|uniref:Uncharacterized protein n=1 Tax=Tetrapyrgos nigripes TaxID=182062 RepID=A0A8H5FIE0_9AGAR|nr:hypothetical protein D9758_013089 [Tetrapyrgos nigripes]
MTFMLSSVRSSAIMQNDENAPQRPGNNKRKSVSLLPSSPAKFKRIGRFSSLLSSSSSVSSSEPDYDRAATRKSAPTCTISLENVTVFNSFDVHTHVKSVSMDYDMPVAPSTPVKTKPQPLDVVDVNVIPFPSNSVSEPDTEPIQVEQSSVHGRRRRSNHLLAKPQSSSAVKKHRRSHSSTISISRRAPLAPISLAEEEPNRRATSPPVCRRGDVKFTALVRRSVLVSLTERENQQTQAAECVMDVDEDMDGTGNGGHSHSDSVTLDILNDEADATLAYQDNLLVDRLGKFLAECGYREPLWSLSLPSHHVPSPPLSIEPRRPASPVLSMVSTSTSSPSLVPSNSASAFDSIIRPSSPIPPDVDAVPTPVPSEPIPIPSIRSSPPPPSPQKTSSSPRSTDPKVLTPPQLVATLVLRHRDRAAIRPRTSRSFDDVEVQDGMGSGSGSYGHMRRRSPLAQYEVVSQNEEL